YLADHDIEGTPVVPMALALEWLAAAAAAWVPGHGASAPRGGSVVRRIGLNHVPGGGDRVTGRGGGGALLEGGGQDGARPDRAPAGTAPGRPLDWTLPNDLCRARPDVYDGRVLFHGPRFQVINEVTGISSAGAAAVLGGARDVGWPCGNWRTDPAVV